MQIPAGGLATWYHPELYKIIWKERAAKPPSDFELDHLRQNDMRLFGFVLLVGILAPGAAPAHAPAAKWKIKNGVVHIEAFFDDDTPAGEAKVQVLDNQGNAILTGTTDARGLSSFPAPAAGAYQLVID